jgi:hypothetical protein
MKSRNEYLNEEERQYCIHFKRHFYSFCFNFMNNVQATKCPGINKMLNRNLLKVSINLCSSAVDNPMDACIP